MTAVAPIDIHSLALSLGLREDEYQTILKILRREPSVSEVQMIAVMWSEHCSYKSSKKHLKKLITKSDIVLQGPGENAGLVAYGTSHAIAFKIESHNHPSFVEPFQGAATGIGGILRDIFTMGARPVALGNYLRFGDLESDLHRHLREGVVSGIAHYGNCMGIPVLGGHIASDKTFNGNILVNVFCMGLARREELFRSNTAKPGQSIMIWGARTGRDGIHGASLLASSEFDENAGESVEQKIRVQVGDPFKEKVLMEATLEAMRTLRDDLAAIQDMGAAGLTSSTTEMATRSGVGMTIELSKVPTRETGMKAWELLLSESQERMLAVVQKGSEKRFEEILKKWGCESAVIGETTADTALIMRFEDEEVVNLPIADLIEAPPAPLPEPATRVRATNAMAEAPADIRGEADILLTLLNDARIASKASVYERYDTTVGNATVLGPGHEAAVLWLPTEERPQGGIAFKGFAEECLAVDYPKEAAQLALMKSLRSLFIVGAKPLAYTDGINVGHALDPEVQWALQETVEGYNAVAEIFNTPCISGNVSMYNQTARGDEKISILPTNFVVAVGEILSVDQAVPSVFQRDGSEVWLLSIPGSPNRIPCGSYYARRFWGSANGLPYLNLKRELDLWAVLQDLQEKRLLLSARDCGAGGLAVSLAKACLLSRQGWTMSKTPVGFDGDLTKTQARRDYLLFSEDQGRVVIEIEGRSRTEVMKLAERRGLEVRKLGQTISEPRFSLRPTLSIDLEKLERAWETCFER